MSQAGRGSRRFIVVSIVAAACLTFLAVLTAAFANESSADRSATQSFQARFGYDWPSTDFSKTTVPAAEFLSGGPQKDGIPSIDNPRFQKLESGRAAGWAARLKDREPVVSINIGGDARAYPLRILIWHEIANDEVGTVPVAVTYCPLCNASVVFDRRLGGAVLEFGTTGMLRHSDLVMYDRQTESWWQQFDGNGLAGEFAGKKLTKIPSRLESFGEFRKRYPEGLVLVPENPGIRQYGVNPYEHYDSASGPFMLTGKVDTYPLAPMDHVVFFETGDQATAVSLDYLRKEGRIELNGLNLEWRPGQSSALDTSTISDGRDIGTVTVQRRVKNQMVDVPYQVTFAFAYRSFFPRGIIVSSQFGQRQRHIDDTEIR